MNVDIYGLFIWLLGLCVGSFLNVVAYRLPLDLSISRPSRSFCPQCGTTLTWAENLPLVGWLWLRGRCRTCHAAISAQYPLVEAACGLAFVLVYHLLFVEPARVGLSDPALPLDLPLLLAWLTLAAALLVCAVIDIVSYTVDVRITILAVWVGLACHALWPRADVVAPIGLAPLGAAGVATMLVSAIMLRRWNAQADAGDESLESDTAPDVVSAATRPRWWSVLAGVALLAVPAIMMFTRTVPAEQAAEVSAWGLAGLAALFLVMVAAAATERAADEEIQQAVEDESPEARRVAVKEVVWLLAPVGAGVFVYLLLTWVPALGHGWAAIARYSPRWGIEPLAGAAYALFGAAIGAAIGWIVRIGFTLALGREAFGTGDIFILAAAGACGGWDIALIGFLLAIGLALLAWIATLLLKRTAMIAFGPPLGLGILAALLFNRPAAMVATHYHDAIVTTWERAPGLLTLLVGILVAGSVGAVVLARWIRQMVEPAEQGGTDGVV